MKTNKFYIFSLIFAALTVFSGNVWGVDASAYKTATLSGSSFSANSNAYTGSSFNSTTDGFTVNITNANNNNKAWNYIKIGGKNGAYTGTITTDGKIDKRITRVELDIDAITAGNVTSITLYKSSDKSSWTSIGTFNKSTGTKAVNIAAAKQATNQYYKIEVVCTKGSSNGLVVISAVKFYRSTFTVSYNANGGSSTMTDSNSPYDTASVVTVKTNAFTAPSGKEFDGWKTGASSGTSYAAGATFNISANTTLYAQWKSSAACAATPTVGAASLNGTYSLSGVGVQCASADPGTNCDFVAYGFVWGTSNASGRPNYLEDNNVDNTGAYAANFTNTITPKAPATKFATGTTYYFRGYAMNGNENDDEAIGYSETVQSFTLQEVWFYKEKTLQTLVADKIVNNGTKVTAPSNPTMTGYTFAGWKNADGDAAFNCATTNIDDDYTLYADWTANQHTLTWDVNGGNELSGSYTSGTVNYGAGITAPANPTRTGYNFAGWHNGTSVVTPLGTMPDNDVTYTAQWTAKTTAITLNKNNEDAEGSNAGSASWTYDQTTKNSYSTATRTGYTVEGYYTAASGGTKILNADGSLAGIAITVDAVVYTNDGKWAYNDTELTLYAQWTENKYTISYDKNGGGDGTGTSGHSNVNWSTDVTLNSCGFTAPQHKYFLGWDTDKDATSPTYSAGASVSKLSNTNGATVTLYAIWANHTFTNYRTLCCNSWDDPTVSYSSSSINVNGTATVTITGPTHGTVSYESSNTGVLTVASNGTVTGVGAGSAHVILHWAEDDGYCEKTMNSEDITVLSDVTVVFHANNGTDETMDNQSIPVSTATALSANVFTAPSTCQYFYGWARSQALADAGTRAYEDEESVTITEGMNLYAIWKTYRYTIATPTKVGAATATLDVAEVDCDGEVTVTSTADASHKGDPTIEITPIDAGTVNGNKIQNIVKNITSVTVTYAAKEVYTVTWKVGGTALEGDDLDGVTVSVTEGNGLETLPANPSGTTLSGADTFMGWSTSELSGLGNSAPSDLFTAAGDEPTIDGNVTYHAVFATQTAEEGDSWDLCSAVNDVAAGDYVITWNNEKYLPSETAAAKNPAVGTGITQSNNKLTNNVTSSMQWSFAGDNTNGWTIRHTKQSTTYYLGATNTAQGIKVTTSEEDGVLYSWTVSVDATDGMLLSAVSGRSLAVLSSDWRNYSSDNYDGTMRLYKHNITEAAYANYITKVVALSSIAISAEAGKTIKTVYKKGETLDLTNMVVTATYADASSRAVTGYTVEPTTSAALTDETKFTVSYTEGAVTKTAEQAINVYELSGIAITDGPTTTTYKSGATLSTTGMVVTATWGDNKISEAVTGYTVDLSTNLATTDTEFEVSYTSAGVDKTATKEIHVYDLSGIAITAPTKTSYTAGDVFNPAGMVVTATWGGEALDKIVETVDGYTYSEEPLVNDADDPANVDVTISYTSNGVTKTATQEVTVNPKAKKIMTWHVANEDPFTTRIYVNAQDKYILALPDDPDPVAAGFTSDYVFKGWTTATSVKKDGSDFTKVNAGVEMSDDEDFYAVFAQKNGEDSPAGYRIVDAAPAASETVIIARKVSSTYYAMTTDATPSHDALTITDGVVTSSTSSVTWSVTSATSGVYLKKSSDYLHMNSSALKVASGTDNGDIVFSSNGNGTYKATRSDEARWIVTSGNGFTCSATEENAAALYIFKYAAATVATYSNYRLVPSTVAVPTGLEAGTYYCASKSITLSQAAGKPIYYTLDGSTPDKTKTLYSSAIVLNTSKTIKAVAYDSETDDYSGVAEAAYTIVTSIAAPTMPATQTFYTENFDVEIEHALTSEGAVIHYSYDDASYSNYSDVLTIDETKTVYAYATIGELTSPKASATYTKGVTYTYKKVTSDAGLAVGMKFIIVSGTNGAGAMTSNYLSVVTIPSPNAQSEIAITNQAVKEFTLSGRSGAYQLVSNEGTLGSDAVKSLSYSAGTKTWTISYSGEQVTIENTTTSYGSLQFNSTRFNTYTSAQSAVHIYAIPFTAHMLTIKNYGGSDKTTAKVVEGGSFVLTNDDKPSSYPTTYTFLNKWTDGTNTYAVGDAVPMGDADMTLQPCWKVTPTANTDINTLPTSVTEIVVEDGKTLTIGADRTLDNLTVEAGGKVDNASNKLTVNNLYIKSEASKSGQVANASAAKLQADAIYMDVTFFKGANTLDETTAGRWYMISAPFDVNLSDGFINPVSGETMTFGQTDGDNIFDLFEYDGTKRATTGVTGWKRVQGKMKAGTACLIGFNPGQPTTIRLKAASAVGEPNKIALSAFDGDATNKNWNGVANPTLHYTDLSCDVQTYNNEDHPENGRKYLPYSASSTSFVVGTAFFVQATGQIDLSAASHSQFRAPKRESERYEACVQIFRQEATEFADQMYVRASETATNEYEQGHDMITWNGTTANTAMIWAENYGKRLAIEEAPLVSNQASYALGIFAPKAGTYRIAATSEDDADLYLTYEGAIIWNLSMGAYELELTKGTTEGYGLLLQAKAPGAATGVDEVTGDGLQVTGAQKIIIDDHVYILRNGQMYSIDGKVVR